MAMNRFERYRGRLLAVVVIQFCISLGILMLASTNEIATFPNWFGLVDVVLAVTLIFSMLALKRAVQENEASAVRTSYLVLTYAVPVLVAAIWFFREQLLLNTFLPGLAWRLYVVFEALPAGLTVLGRKDT